MLVQSHVATFRRKSLGVGRITRRPQYAITWHCSCGASFTANGIRTQREAEADHRAHVREAGMASNEGQEARG